MRLRDAKTMSRIVLSNTFSGSTTGRQTSDVLGKDGNRWLNPL